MTSPWSPQVSPIAKGFLPIDQNRSAPSSDFRLGSTNKKNHPASLGWPKDKSPITIITNYCIIDGNWNNDTYIFSIIIIVILSILILRKIILLLLSSIDRWHIFRKIKHPAMGVMIIDGNPSISPLNPVWFIGIPLWDYYNPKCILGGVIPEPIINQPSWISAISTQKFPYHWWWKKPMNHGWIPTGVLKCFEQSSTNHPI